MGSFSIWHWVILVLPVGLVAFVIWLFMRKKN